MHGPPKDCRTAFSNSQTWQRAIEMATKGGDDECFDPLHQVKITENEKITDASSFNMMDEQPIIHIHPDRPMDLCNIALKSCV